MISALCFVWWCDAEEVPLVCWCWWVSGVVVMGGCCAKPIEAVSVPVQAACLYEPARLVNLSPFPSPSARLVNLSPSPLLYQFCPFVLGGISAIVVCVYLM